MHPSSRRVHEIFDELKSLHDGKQMDYGAENDPFANVRATESWGIPAWKGALLRLNDKVVRLQALSRNGVLKNESAEDSMRDIAVYSVIALVLFEEYKKENDRELSAYTRHSRLLVDSLPGVGGQGDAAGEP